MTIADTIGYLGAILVVATYSMRTMVPLRMAGIASNVILITYGYYARAYPTLFLHLILLPLNAWRLREMLELIREVTKAATGDLSMDWLKPFMDKKTLKPGQILFSRGDVADEMYFVISGRLRLRELGVDILPGALVGELGLLAPGVPARRRSNPSRKPSCKESLTTGSNSSISRTRTSASIFCASPRHDCSRTMQSWSRNCWS